MAVTGGYRYKDEAQLAWNAIKKAAIAKATLEASIYREELLNEYLTELWDRFEQALIDGELLELGEGTFDEIRKTPGS